MDANTIDTCWAIVPAAGIGKRMETDKPKQYLELAGETVIARTLRRLAQHPLIGGIAVGVAPDDPYWPSVHADLNGLQKPVLAFHGGDERCHTVCHGLDRLSEQGHGDVWVLVHDAARPCLRPEDITALITTVQASGADGGILAAPVRDTMKRVTTGSVIEGTVSREALWHALTPQMFQAEALRAAIRAALAAGTVVTDEASAMEFQGAHVIVVAGEADNLKITHPGDLALAEAILMGQEAAA